MLNEWRAVSRQCKREWENEWRAVSRQCVYPVSSVSYRGAAARARAPWALRWSQLDRAGAALAGLAV